VFSLRFSNTFDIHHKLDALPVSMAQLLAICHDIVLRGQQRKQQGPCITTQPPGTAPQQQQQQQEEGASVETAAAGPATETETGVDADDAGASSPVDWSMIVDSNPGPMPGSSSTSRKQVVLNPQQQRQQEHVERQLRRLGILPSDSSSSVRCKPIPAGAAAGVVCFLPRNTDLQQLSQLAARCFEDCVDSSGDCRSREKVQAAHPAGLDGQQQQQEVEEARCMLLGSADGGEERADGSSGNSSDAAAEDDAAAVAGQFSQISSTPLQQGEEQGDQQEKGQCLELKEQDRHSEAFLDCHEQHEQGQLLHQGVDVTGAAGGSYLANLRSLSVDRFHSLDLQRSWSLDGSLAGQGVGSPNSGAGAGVGSAGVGLVAGHTTEPIPEGEEEDEQGDCGPASMGAGCTVVGDRGVAAAAATGASAAAAAAKGVDVSARCEVGRARWLVERNILNDHFKGVTIVTGWDLGQRG
jgi:hypothetical protein